MDLCKMFATSKLFDISIYGYCSVQDRFCLHHSFVFIHSFTCLCASIQKTQDKCQHILYVYKTMLLTVDNFFFHLNGNSQKRANAQHYNNYFVWSLECHVNDKYSGDINNFFFFWLHTSISLGSDRMTFSSGPSHARKKSPYCLINWLIISKFSVSEKQ